MNFCLKEFMRIRNEMKIPKQMQSAIHEMEDIRNLHRYLKSKEHLKELVKKTFNEIVENNNITTHWYETFILKV